MKTCEECLYWDNFDGCCISSQSGHWFDEMPADTPACGAFRPEEIEQEQVNDADQQKSKSVKYDARKKTLAYYAEYCRITNSSISPKKLLYKDMQKATTTNGLCIWTPNLVFFAWKIGSQTLWIEHAIGYLSDLIPLASAYGPEWIVHYQHRDKIRHQNMHRLLDRL
ncbi:hypothetical protein [Akkermansia muciniphila]|uniref:hypothetical protein n=1 Tax=Akkermansia muciniphila TaxID=239935 RepID=UPI0011AF46C1|nr:hypothetical protein [Akkermansia muciniphila]